MNEEQKKLVLVAIDSHIDKLYQSEQAYHKNGDTIMVKEMLDEIRKFENLKKELNL
jgi:hypothetical protein